MELNKESVLKELDNGFLDSTHHKTMEMLLSTNQLPKAFTNCSQDSELAVKLLTLSYLFSHEGKDYVTLKDGLIFTHMESVYEHTDSCLSTLTLHWRDPYISEYYSHNTSYPLLTDAVLILTDDFELETLEGDLLQVKDPSLTQSL